MAMQRKRNATTKKAPTKRRVTATAKKAVTTVKSAARRRYKPSGKVSIKTVGIDIAAIAAGVVAGGIVGQALGKQGVDSRVAGVVPALVGGVLALKVKSPVVKMLGIGMGAAAGVSMINNVTKNAGLSGDSMIDAVDVYANPDLLGLPVNASSGVTMGVPVSLNGETAWNTGVNIC